MHENALVNSFVSRFDRLSRESDRLLGACSTFLTAPDPGVSLAPAVIPRTPYVAAYLVDGDTVRILRVLHGAQMWPDGTYQRRLRPTPYRIPVVTNAV